MRITLPFTKNSSRYFSYTAAWIPHLSVRLGAGSLSRCYVNRVQSRRSRSRFQVPSLILSAEIILDGLGITLLRSRQPTCCPLLSSRCGRQATLTNFSLTLDNEYLKHTQHSGRSRSLAASVYAHQPTGLTCRRASLVDNSRTHTVTRAVSDAMSLLGHGGLVDAETPYANCLLVLSCL